MSTITKTYEIDQKIKVELENICKDLFSTLFPKLELRWMREPTIKIKTLCILNKESIEYCIQYIDENTIKFEKNGQIISKAKSINGLKVGLKDLINIELLTNKLQTTIYT